MSDWYFFSFNIDSGFMINFKGRFIVFAYEITIRVINDWGICRNEVREVIEEYYGNENLLMTMNDVDRF